MFETLLPLPPKPPTSSADNFLFESQTIVHIQKYKLAQPAFMKNTLLLTPSPPGWFRGLLEPPLWGWVKKMGIYPPPPPPPPGTANVIRVQLSEAKEPHRVRSCSLWHVFCTTKCNPEFCTELMMVVWRDKKIPFWGEEIFAC